MKAKFSWFCTLILYWLVHCVIWTNFRNMSSFNGVSHAINCFGGKKKKKGNNRQAKKCKESTVDMAKRAGRVGSIGSRVILSGLKTGSGQSGCRSGWLVFFTWKFLFFIFFIKKTICICHLDSYATYYLM